MSASQCEECGDVYDPTAGHRCKTYTVVGLPSNAEVEAAVAARVHLWVPGLRWEHCCVCGVVKRADGKNKPCKGPTKVVLR